MYFSTSRATLLALCALFSLSCDSSSSGPDDGGAGLFLHPMPWTKDVSALPKSPESDTIIAALDAAGGWGTGDFRTDMSFNVLFADASTPRRTFTPKDEAWAEANLGDSSLAEFYRPDCEHVAYPVPATGALEGESGYACEKDGDCHLLVVDTAGRRLYEMWRAHLSGPTFLGGCAVVWDLSRSYDSTLRGRGCTSADAAGFPITAMLATADEVATGEVKHALRFILPNARIQNGMYVPPATHSTFPTRGGPNLPPYGVRFRLKDSYDENRLSSPGARVLARALKRYGMFLSDGGSVPLTVAGDAFTRHKWSEFGFDSRSLSSLKVTDFEVVELGQRIDWKADHHLLSQPVGPLAPRLRDYARLRMDSTAARAMGW